MIISNLLLHHNPLHLKKARTFKPPNGIAKDQLCCILQKKATAVKQEDIFHKMYFVFFYILSSFPRNIKLFYIFF